MLKHVSFVTQRAQAVLDFYTALGGTVSKDLLTQEGYRRVVVQFEGGTLQFFELTGVSGQDTPRPLPHWAEHIALTVGDLPSTVQRLRTQGVTVTRETQPSPSGKQVAFVLDPDRRQVELLEKV